MLQSTLLILSMLLPVQPVADESWIRLPQASLPAGLAPTSVVLSWAGQRYPAHSLALREGRWLVKFHVRAQGQARVEINPVEGLNLVPASAAQGASDVCHVVTRQGETLWHVGSALAGTHADPYLYVLALFAANRELLDNNPDELRIGDQLHCPRNEDLAQLGMLSQQQRQALYQRLVGYGRRLSRR